MRELDIQTWNRRLLYEHFKEFHDPNFAITFRIDVTQAYRFSKKVSHAFFPVYLHACMRAINNIENLRLRIVSEDKVLDFDQIHASATVLRPNKTFGFTFINYDEDLLQFIKNFEEEKARVLSTNDLFPPVNSMDCIHCSAIPWIDFIGHKEPYSGINDSVPKLAFGKVTDNNKSKIMTVAITVNHALVDGYHLGLFAQKFQEYLNEFES